MEDNFLGIDDLGLDELEGLDGVDGLAIPAMPDMAWVPQVQQSAWGHPGHPTIKREPGTGEQDTQYFRKDAPRNGTPPATSTQDISPDFSVPSSPENSSDDDGIGSSGCLTPPKAPGGTGAAEGGAGRSASLSRQAVLPPVVKTESSKLPASKTKAAPPATAPAPGPASAAHGEAKPSLVTGAMSYDPKVIEDNRTTRLKRNREAAQQFRKRKKEYVNAVERDAGRLRAENMQLRARLSAAESENRVLREENAFYRNIVNGRSNGTARAAGTMPGMVPVSTSTVGPASKVAKVAAGTMCAMMMVVGVAQIGGQQMRQQAVGVSTDLVRQQVELQWDAPQAQRRRMMEEPSEPPALPLPGSLWGHAQPNISMRGHERLLNASSDSLMPLGYNSSLSGANDSHKWLSLIQPYTGGYDGVPSRVKQYHRLTADALQRSFLHRGFLTQDGATGELQMDWEMLSRFGELSNPSTRYIYCPEAQHVPAWQPEAHHAQRHHHHQSDSQSEVPVAEVQLLDEDDYVEWGQHAKSPQKALGTGGGGGVVSDTAVSVPAGPLHPPDFEDGELEGGSHHQRHRRSTNGGSSATNGGASSIEDDDGSGSGEFGVSLLIPAGGANETTLLGGAVVPSMQMVELRCSVANVTQRTFTI